jgi:integrase
MGRLSNELTVKFVESNRNGPGMYCDGGGLYLRVAAGGSKQWIFRYAADDPSHPRGYRLRDMGLGSVDDLRLAEAREEARKLRILRKQKIDPISYRTLERAQRVAEHANMRTFQQCAEGFIADKEKQWTNAKHRYEFEATLRKYVFPTLGPLPVNTIETPHILEVIKPLYARVPTTAQRTCNRIESVLDWATVHRYRSGDNPARWQDYLEHALPAAPAPKHLPALPYDQAPEFMRRLRERSDNPARCLEFLILTCVRAENAVEAVWSEIDLEARVWTIPANRMKRDREHRVPLSSRAVEILEEMDARRESDFIFPGAKKGRPVGEGAPNEVAQEIAEDLKVKVTAHGMRNTFKDWATEETSHEDIVSEMALAHKVKDSTVKAYRRGDLFEKRRKLMDAWADYCEKRSGASAVVPIAGRR